MIRTGLNDNSSWKTELIQRARRQSAAMTRLSGVGVFWALLSLLAAVGASFGFYMPYWLQGQLNGIPVYFGVFRRCNYPRRTFNDEFEMVEQCGRYSSFTDIPSLWWQVATIAVGTGCGLAVLIALIAILAICIRGIISPFIARIAGVLQMCSGLLIGGGVAIYPHGWTSMEVQQACGNLSGSYKFGTCTFYWAFYLTAGGAASTLITAMFSCCASTPKRDRPYDDV